MVKVRKKAVLELNWSKVTTLNYFLKSSSIARGVYMWVFDLSGRFFPYYVGTASGEGGILQRQKDHVRKINANHCNLYDIKSLNDNNFDLYSAMNEYVKVLSENNKRSFRTQYIVKPEYFVENPDSNSLKSISKLNLDHSSIACLDLNDVNFSEIQNLTEISDVDSIASLAKLIESVIIKFMMQRFTLELYKHGRGKNTLLGKIESHSSATNLIIRNTFHMDDAKYFSQLGREFLIFEDVFNVH